MKQKLYKVVFPDENYILMLYDNACSLLHYLHDNLGIKDVRVYILSFWESVKYLLGRN